MSLTAAERERGWVEYHCPDHGFLVAMLPCLKVTCSCGKVARKSGTNATRRTTRTKSLQN